MKQLHILVLITFILNSCFMSEEEYQGDSRYSNALVNTNLETATIGPFNLSAGDTIINAGVLRSLDSEGNLYIIKRADLETTVWSRFWMGDSIVRKGELASPLLEKSLDSLNPYLILYLDSAYYESSETPELSFSEGDSVNFELTYFVDSYDFNADNYESEIKEEYSLATSNDSAWNAKVTESTFPKIVQNIKAKYILREEVTEVDSVTTSYFRPLFKIDLSQLSEMWEGILVESSADAQFHFLNIGVRILDDYETTPIRFESEDDVNYRPRLTFQWYADSTLDSVTTLPDGTLDTLQVEASETAEVNRWAQRGAFEITKQDRQGEMTFWSDMGDTLKVNIPWDEVLSEMGVNASEEIRDDKALLWARLNVVIPPGSFVSSYKIGSRFNSLVNLYALDNTPEFLNYIEHQFEDSASFKPEAILFENTAEDTLSLYINELARRAVNRELSGDSLLVNISFAYAYTDSTSGSSKQAAYEFKPHSFDRLNLGSKDAVEYHLDIGWIDLEEAP